MKIFKLSRDFPSSQIQGIYSTTRNVRWNIFAEWYHRGRQPPHNAPPNTRWPKSPSYHGYLQCDRVYGCLNFTWENRSVHGLAKSYAKFGTGKFCPRIAFTICTNQFHLPENDCEGLKLVSKMALKSGTRISAWNTAVRKNRTDLFRCSVAPGNFRWNDPKRRAPFTFQPDFLETFVNGRLFIISDFTFLSTSKSGKSRIKNSSLVWSRQNTRKFFLWKMFNVQSSKLFLSVRNQKLTIQPFCFIHTCLSFNLRLVI